MATGAVVALGLGWATGWWWPGASAPAGGGAPQAKPVAVESQPVVFGPLTQTAVVTGQVSAETGAVLKTEVTGKVAALPFTEGTPVKKGDVLVKLDDATEQATLAQARANVALTSNTLARTRRLQEADAASAQELDQAAAEASLARANVKLAEANLAKRTIVAPFDGVAGIRSVTVGELVQPGQTLLTVADNTRLKISFRLPERYTSVLKVNDTVNLLNDAGEVISNAPVTALDSQIDPATRTLAALAIIENSHEHGLTAGQFVSVQVPVASLEHAPLVPEQAVVARGMDNLIYIVSTSGTQTVASATKVTVALRGGGKVALQGNLPENTSVVTAGQQKLQQPAAPVTLVTPTQVKLRPAEVERLPESR